MNKVYNYNNFLFNLILEDNSTSRFYLSRDLKKILKKSKHPIAKRLLELDSDKEEKKMTLIDIDEDNINNFTFVQSNKIIDRFLEDEGVNIKDREEVEKITSQNKNIINDYINIKKYWSYNRSSIKMGKFVNKIFPDEYKQSGSPNHDIESFVNDMKFIRSNKFSDFKIIKGEDIKKYYLGENYDSRSSSSNLGNSCMRYEKCQDYIDFYIQNNVEMVVLFSDEEEDKIVGRAILWDIQFIDGEEVNRKFMDRIYSIYDYDIDHFKEYAKENGWLYKRYQNMDEHEQIVDTIDDSTEYRTLKTRNNIKKTEYYPYMDTMKYFYVDYGYLSNEHRDLGDNVYKLEETNGKYEIPGKIYISFYDDFYEEDEVVWVDDIEDHRLPEDAVWVESEGQWISDDYANNYYKYSERMDEYIHEDDAIYIKSLDDYVTERYAEDNFHISDITDEFLTDEEAVYSDLYETYIRDSESIEIITEYGVDYVFKDDKDSYIPYFNLRKKEMEYYSNTYDGFIKVNVTDGEDNFDSFRQVYKHKDWDKEHIFKWNGRLFYDIDGKLKDYLTGQKRLWEKRIKFYE